MIFRLPFTQAIGFDINDFLVNNYIELEFLINNTDLKNQEASKEEGIRRVRNAKKTGEYVPIQMEPCALLDDADPLETGVPCLSIGQVDPQVELDLITAMRDRAHDAIASYRADPITKDKSLRTLRPG